MTYLSASGATAEKMAMLTEVDLFEIKLEVKDTSTDLEKRRKAYKIVVLE